LYKYLEYSRILFKIKRKGINIESLFKKIKNKGAYLKRREEKHIIGLGKVFLQIVDRDLIDF